MGQTTSNVARRVTKSVSSMFSSCPETESSADVGRFAVTPFVFKRTSSMYFDEDGDLAHEFYEEVRQGQKYTMRRSWDNLTPEVIGFVRKYILAYKVKHGEVDLPYPRINVDFPTVICRAPYS